MATLDLTSKRFLVLPLVLALLGLLALPATAQDTGDDESRTSEEESDEASPLDELKEAGKAAEDPFKELFDDISGNMKRIEELLNQGQTGDSTQGVQQQTLQRLDDLIKLVEESCQQCSGSGGGEGNPQQKQNQPQSRDQKRPGQQRQNSEREAQPTPEEELSRKEEQQPKDGEPNNPDQVPNTRTSEGDLPPAEVGDLPKARQGHGRWGQLPKRLIEEMYDNGNRKLPEKYRLVLEEYWRRLPKSTAK